MDELEFQIYLIYIKKIERPNHQSNIMFCKSHLPCLVYFIKIYLRTQFSFIFFLIFANWFLKNLRIHVQGTIMLSSGRCLINLRYGKSEFVLIRRLLIDLYGLYFWQFVIWEGLLLRMVMTWLRMSSKYLEVIQI